MSIRLILALTDLASRDDCAVHRARLLAATQGAALNLLHVPSHVGVQHTEPLTVRAAAIGTRLERELGRAVKVIIPAPGHFDDALGKQARVADLVVVPDRRERSVAAFVHGPLAIRVLRAVNGPVLVTRPGPVDSYARILVAMGLRNGAAARLQSAAQLEPNAEIELFHALDTRDEAKLRSAEAPEAAVNAFRRGRTERARRRMLELTRDCGVAGDRVSSRMGRGDPGQQIVARLNGTGVSLVVVGKTRASAWGDFLCGSVASCVLSWGTSDILLIPRDPVADATRPVGRAPGRNEQAVRTQPVSQQS